MSVVDGGILQKAFLSAASCVFETEATLTITMRNREELHEEKEERAPDAAVQTLKGNNNNTNLEISPLMRIPKWLIDPDHTCPSNPQHNPTRECILVLSAL